MKMTNSEESPLRTLRESAGLSRARLARVVDVDPSTIMGWEQGAIPSFDNAVKLSIALETPLDTLAVMFGIVEKEELVVGHNCDGSS